MYLRFFIKCHEVHKYFFFTFKNGKKIFVRSLFLIKAIDNFLCRTDTFESSVSTNFIVKFC